MGVFDVSYAIIQCPAIVIAAHHLNIVVMNQLDALLEVARAITQIAGTQQGLCTRLQQGVNRRLQALVFSVHVANQSNATDRWVVCRRSIRRTGRGLGGW